MDLTRRVHREIDHVLNRAVRVVVDARVRCPRLAAIHGTREVDVRIPVSAIGPGDIDRARVGVNVHRRERVLREAARCGPSEVVDADDGTPGLPAVPG